MYVPRCVCMYVCMYSLGLASLGLGVRVQELRF